MGIYYNLKLKRIFGTRKERYYCGVKRQNKTKMQISERSVRPVCCPVGQVVCPVLRCNPVASHNLIW